jgi:hypothetical protein
VTDESLEIPRLNGPAMPPADGTNTPTGPRELFVRHAVKDGRTVALLRAIDYGDACVVEAHVFAQGSAAPTFPGPYTFGDAHDATAFVTDAVEALMYLGCEIHAQ